MATLIETAQRVFDLYEQNYAPNDRFLDLDDFKFHIATTYSTMLDKQFQIERKAGKTETGFSNVELTAQWMVEEKTAVEYEEKEGKYFAKLKQPVLGFRWDTTANALEGIIGIGKSAILYRKVSLQEKKFWDQLPAVGDRAFYYLNKPQEIIFRKATTGAEIKVQYVPAVVGQQNDCLLADSIADEIVSVLKLMFESKSGNFIDKLDDQNPNNPIPQINPVTK